MKILCAKSGRIFLSLFLFFLFAFFARPVFALEAEGLSIYPSTEDSSNPLTKSWFIYQLPPGDSKEDELAIFNALDESITVDIYSVDSKLNNVGGFALAERNELKRGVGAWIHLEKSGVILLPGQETRIPFTMTIPEGLEPGEYSGGIVVELPEEISSEESSIKTKTRIGTRVYETVPGEIIQRVTLENFQAKFDRPPGIHTFEALLNNTGNVSTSVKLHLTVKNIQRGFISTIFPEPEERILETEVLIPPGASLTVPLQMTKPRVGKYEVNFEGEYGEKKFHASPVSFWAIPWFEIGLTTGGLGLLMFFFLLDGLFMRRLRKQWQKYHVQRGDGLLELAEAHNISWKKIVRVNRLKRPYELSSDMDILLPKKLKRKK